MTPLNWIMSAVAVALFGTAVYLALEVNRLTDRLVTLDAALAQEVATRTEESVGLRTDVDAHAERLAALGSTEEVASHVIDSALPDLVQAIAVSLTEDQEKAALLRGETGPIPAMDDVRSDLIANGLINEVANSIWELHYRELAVMPEVVATVAEEVFRTYGDDLKGADGKPADAAAVAAALAAEPAFLSLLELTR